jgi:hypothetical protein
MAGGVGPAFYPSPAGPPSKSDRFQLGVSKLQLVTEPAYLQVVSTSGTSAQVIVGRLITEGESFFVDGMELAVAMIYFVPTPVNNDNKDTVDYGMKFITIRTPLPKVPVTLEALTIQKCVVGPYPEPLPMLPPFNMEHDIIDDVNIPDNVIGYPNCEVYPDVEHPDNLGPVDDVGTGYGTTDKLADAYDTIAERRVQDVDPTLEYWIKETKEPRFDTNLLEEKFYAEEIWLAGGVGATGFGTEELWWWKNIETMPWLYTEFILPEIPEATGLEDMGYIGDYILVSSFWTQDWFTMVCPTCQGGQHVEQVRVKFDYDAAFSSASVDTYVEGDPPYPESKSGLYVNTIGVIPTEPVPEEPCDYDDPDFGGDGNGVIDKAEAINSIIDYFDEVIDKALAIEVIIAYFDETPC